MSSENFPHEEGGNAFGIFYPTGYIIGAFADYETANDAAKRLLDAQFSGDEVSALSGEQVRQEIENAQPPKHLLERIKETIHRSIGSEGFFWDEDLALAERGAGFVTVYCGNGKAARAAGGILRAQGPKALRHYQKLAVEDLLPPELPGAQGQR